MTLYVFLLFVVFQLGAATTTPPPPPAAVVVPPAPGSPFHLAIPVNSIEKARAFYGGVLGLEEGRRSEDKWQDYSLKGMR